MYRTTNHAKLFCESVAMLFDYDREVGLCVISGVSGISLVLVTLAGVIYILAQKGPMYIYGGM